MPRWKIISYAILVKNEKWDLEPVDGSDKPVVPEAVRILVAEYLAQGV